MIDFNKTQIWLTGLWLTRFIYPLCNDWIAWLLPSRSARQPGCLLAYPPPPTATFQYSTPVGSVDSVGGASRLRTAGRLCLCWARGGGGGGGSLTCLSAAWMASNWTGVRCSAEAEPYRSAVDIVCGEWTACNQHPPHRHGPNSGPVTGRAWSTETDRWSDQTAAETHCWSGQTAAETDRRAGLVRLPPIWTSSLVRLSLPRWTDFLADFCCYNVFTMMSAVCMHLSLLTRAPLEYPAQRAPLAGLNIPPVNSRTNSRWRWAWGCNQKPLCGNYK